MERCSSASSDLVRVRARGKGLGLGLGVRARARVICELGHALEEILGLRCSAVDSLA